MGFFRQEYWRGLPFPSPGDLPDPGIEPWSSELQTDSVPSETPGKPQKLIELINKLSKFTGYKDNLQKLIYYCIIAMKSWKIWK